MSGATSTMNEPEWPVHVYRRTVDRTWQWLRPKNPRGQIVVVKAAPRHDAIVLPSLRIRIRLRGDSESSTSQPQQGGKRSESHSNSGSVVVRRRDRVLIAQPTRALVLRFRTLKDCLDFCDRLVALNPPPILAPSPRSPMPSSASASQGATIPPTQQQHPDTLANSHNHHNHSSQTREILSCVTRLLCDPDFAHLVNRLEDVLMESEDGRIMLESLIAQKEPSACLSLPNSQSGTGASEPMEQT